MNRMRWIGPAGLAALVPVFILAGCGASVTHSADAAEPADGAGVPVVSAAVQPQLPVRFSDAAGRTVQVRDVSRIVVLNGGIAETVVALGLGGNIVGREVSADFAEVADVPLVSNGHDVSAEGVLALRPTVVIGDGRSGPPEALAAIQKAGVPVVRVPEVWTLNDVDDRVTVVAQALGVPGLGGQLNAELTQRVEQVRQAADQGSRPVVAFLYLRGTAAVYLLGGDGSGADDLIEAAGGVDAGTKAGLSNFTPLTPESLAAAAPDVLLVMDKGLESVGGIDGLLALPGVAQTPAGRDRRVISMPDGQLLSFGPRTPATLQVLADQL